MISFFPGEIENVKTYYIDCGVTAENSDFNKLSYLTKGSKVKKLVKEINPDVISVHGASSYGAVAALAGIKGYYLSVWGWDIYDFPRKSFLHKKLIQFSLKKPAMILSTSNAMAEETRKYTSNRIEVTPFGVDMNLFNPAKKSRSDDGKLIFGTVKALKPKYGIDYLIKAVSRFAQKHPEVDYELRIAGDGPNRAEYEALAVSEGIGDKVKWLGYISQESAATEWANMDIGVVPSTLESESFGVSAVEAQACETALIISDIPGLEEATLPGVTCMVVERKNVEQLADAIEKLAFDSALRQKMGKAGREYVTEQYEYSACFRRIDAIFEKNLSK